MKKLPIFLIIGGCLILSCIVVFVVVFLSRGLVSNSITSTISSISNSNSSSTQTLNSVNLTGTWSGTYTIFYPKACAGEGNWSANIIDQNGTLSGTYTSDAKVNGNLTGTATDSQIKWTVGGEGGVSLDGNIVKNSIGGTYVGPACGGNSYTSGVLSGNKK